MRLHLVHEKTLISKVHTRTTMSAGSASHPQQLEKQKLTPKCGVTASADEIYHSNDPSLEVFDDLPLDDPAR